MHRGNDNPVRRLQISFKNGQWRIDREIRIPHKRLLKSQDLPSVKDGEIIRDSWYEAKDRNGKTIYRRFLPLFGQLENLYGNGSISTADIPPDEISVDILIPDSPDLTELQLFSDNKYFRDIMKEAGRPTNQIAVIKLNNQKD